MPMASRAPVRAVLLGAVLGLVAAGVVLTLADRLHWPLPTPAPAPGPLLSDADGALRTLVVHYEPAAGPTVEAAYRDFLPHLPAEVTVLVVCPDAAAFEDFRARVGPTACTLVPYAVGHPITAWSRDRWLALAPGEPGAPTTLLRPASEEGATLWPARAGDRQVALDLAAAMPGRVRAETAALHFDGGDFAADAATAFVAPAVLRRNLQRTCRTRDELVAKLERALGRRVVLLEEAPDHHVGMFLMPAGRRTVLVGDPSLAARLLGRPDGGLPEGQPGLCPPAGEDASPGTQALFDAVARRCEREGYRVLRLPLVPGRDGRTYVTYCNVILDERGGRRTAYMPSYAGAEPLNAAAEATWCEAGWDVRRVDCTRLYGHFGTLRCLVSVMERGQD